MVDLGRLFTDLSMYAVRQRRPRRLALHNKQLWKVCGVTGVAAENLTSSERGQEITRSKYEIEAWSGMQNKNNALSEILNQRGHRDGGEHQAPRVRRPLLSR